MAAQQKKITKKKTSKPKTSRTRRAAGKSKAKRPKKRAASKKTKSVVLGVVTHYFPQVKAAVIRLKRPLSVGDAVSFKGHTTDFTQTVKSMEVDHVSLQKAKKGAEIGLEVKERVREHDLVLPAKKGFFAKMVGRLPFA